MIVVHLQELPSRANYALNQQILQMHKQNLHRELAHIVEDRVQIQRLFALIQFLEQKKATVQKELNLTKRLFEKAKTKGDEIQGKKLFLKVMALHSTVYGLSQEKIEVCKQFQSSMDRLSAQLCSAAQGYYREQLNRQKDMKTQKNDHLIKLNEDGKIGAKPVSKSRLKLIKSQRHNVVQISLNNSFDQVCLNEVEQWKSDRWQTPRTE